MNSERLVQWYEQHKRSFPWRAEPTPYNVWVAEIMSQQTVMAALLPFFARFMGRFPQLEDLAAAGEADVMAAWAGLGYYSRARNLHAAAKLMVAQGIPSTYEGWLELPGVGPYTAAAVSSQCFAVAEPVWDGNVQRVMSRLFARTDAHAPIFRAEMLLFLKNRLIAGALNPSCFNQSLMELGATICTPKNPVCGRCPLSADCFARKKNLQAQLPPAKPRKKFVEVTAHVFIARRRNAFLLVQRASGQWFSGLWDFPSELGGVKEPRRSVGVQGRALDVKPVRHTITHHKILLHAIEVGSAQVTQLEHRAVASRWFTLDEMLSEQTPLATTAKKVLRALGVERSRD